MLHQPNHTLVCNKSFQKKNTLATRSIHSALQKQHVIRKKVNNFLLVEIVFDVLKKVLHRKWKLWGTCNNIKERNSTKMLVIHPMASFCLQEKDDRSKLLKGCPYILPHQPVDLSTVRSFLILPLLKLWQRIWLPSFPSVHQWGETTRRWHKAWSPGTGRTHHSPSWYTIYLCK